MRSGLALLRGNTLHHTFRQRIGAIVALSLIGAGLATSGCTKKSDDGNLMVYHGSITSDLRSFDPAVANDYTSMMLMPTIHESLYQYAYLSETYKLVPLLAADMPEVSEDGLTVTIPIKSGVRFQDDPAFKDSNGRGRELKAQDFVYAFKRLALPTLQSEGWWIFDDRIVGLNAFNKKLKKTQIGDIPQAFIEDIEGLKAIDDHTLQIKLNKPYPQLAYALATPFSAPMAQEVVAAYADENGAVHDHPVGTGPFVLKQWKRGKTIVLERNPNYHPEFYPTEGAMEFRKRGLLADAGKPLPFLDRVWIDVHPDPQTSWLNFLKGKEDLSTIPRENFDQAIKERSNLSPDLASKGIRLTSETGARFYYLSFNMRDRLLGGNKALRQAISSAIDRDKWIEKFTNGRGLKQVNALPPGIPDRPKTAKIKYDFNLTQAKELLKKAGYPGGKGLPELTMDMRDTDSVNRQMGEFFTQQLAAIGIKINVVYNTFPAFIEKMKQGSLQLSYGGWGMDYPDAENVFQTLYGPNQSPGPNESNFDHSEMNKLYEQMSRMSSGPKRAEIIQKMDDLLQEECPWALGYYHTEYWLSQPWLLNLRPNEIIASNFKFLRINKDVKKRYLESH